MDALLGNCFFVQIHLCEMCIEILNSRQNCISLSKSNNVVLCIRKPYLVMCMYSIYLILTLGFKGSMYGEICYLAK